MRSIVRSSWLVPAALFGGIALVYLLTISPNPSPDVFTADFAARHIATTGDPVPDISDFPLLDDNIIRETWIVETADGREAVGRAPGVIAASVPAYFLLRPAGISAVPGGAMAALVTAGTVTLLFLTLRPRTGTRKALLAALLLGLATPLWSVAADGMWPHTLTCFAIVGMAWAADRERWWVVGLCGGVALWGRLHAAVICAVLGVLLAVVRRRPAIAVRVGVVSGAMLALMSVWTYWMYGSWDPSSGYRAGDFTGNADRNVIDVVNFLGFWIAPDRGLLIWTPLLLVMAPALRRGWRDLPDWSRALLVSGVVYLLLQGLLVRFSGGDQFYGYRTTLELLVCATPALALSAHRMGERARRAFAPVAALQFAMITPGAVVDGFAVKVAHVWNRNAFLWGPFERPLAWLVLVGGALVVAGAVAMAWRRTEARPA
ncbi:hypothetical protein [Nocardioides stalactiti]|uniref:hypothetical protein n=1 Tax=Nocardioides stalactiti TaxID=2755356 RepID=UPI001600B90E|nr:hypothetical protein [Nocardioides stalactiti]